MERKKLRRRLERAVGARRLRRIDRGSVDMDSTRGLLSTLPSGELVGIQQEHRRPGMLWVGVPDEMTRQRFYLSEVDPQARWRRTRGYRIKQLTAVEWGSHYMRGLAAVADPCPGVH